MKKKPCMIAVTVKAAYVRTGAKQTMRNTSPVCWRKMNERRNYN